MLGEQFIEHSESKGLLHFNMSAELVVVTVYICEIEYYKKLLSNNLLEMLSNPTCICGEILFTIWLGDKIFDLIREETTAINSIDVVQKSLMMRK